MRLYVKLLCLLVAIFVLRFYILLLLLMYTVSGKNGITLFLALITLPNDNRF